MDNLGEFTCAECGETYGRQRTEEEALEEKDALFPDVPIEDCAIVCDDCFKKLMPYA
jgi:hypothetical protein